MEYTYIIFKYSINVKISLDNIFRPGPAKKAKP